MRRANKNLSLKVNITTRRSMYKAQNGKCSYCEQPMLTIEETAKQNKLSVKNRVAQHNLSATVEHLKQCNYGGDNDPGNLRLAHYKCNKPRGNMNWLLWKSIVMGDYIGLPRKYVKGAMEKEVIF